MCLRVVSLVALGLVLEGTDYPCNYQSLGTAHSCQTSLLKHSFGMLAVSISKLKVAHLQLPTYCYQPTVTNLQLPIILPLGFNSVATETDPAAGLSAIGTPHTCRMQHSTARPAHPL